jgi:Mrp family chromosome partitioning ATPase
MRSRGVGMLPPSSESHRLVPTQKTKDQDQSRGFSELAIDQRIRPVKLHHSADRAAQVSSARVIVVGNEKGASGKSTVAMHVAIALMKQNKRVATLDLDSNKRYSRTSHLELKFATL